MTWQGFLQTIRSDSRLRLAPTPSGYLHAGNALNFLLVHRAAHAVHPPARVLLRIDDLDDARKRPEYVQDVFDTLRWLGISWDEGPEDAADFETRWSQHVRLSHYHAALDLLRQTGLLFACRKSRKDLAAHGEQYPPDFRDQGLGLDDPDVAWRIRTPAGFPLPDFVVRRRDGVPAYQVASLVDDRLFGITHLVRGADLEGSTAAQRYLAECLGWRDFLSVLVYHHPLLAGADGQKLSKSAGAQGRPLRDSGRAPAELNELAERLVAGEDTACG
ncbi:MAG: glutamate--tRNA ligase family protein [Saprospiraceae bacterium]|nr:glutamate--tRNA ligase family protein [Saprospiraceae bacterium]